ncbi:hypothetical protein CDEST_12225 [Colletotrichum destructivum]|uniref:Uncharacterized protein n=1 Tax=Colletotrichum destructivum TaxID=34406 RepID=A0AAX4IVG5_9PEZI|nr:hypothetical protein CDEST_12225 [Colletotrichum destructivum]
MFAAGAYTEHRDTWAYTTHAPSAVLETAVVSFYRDALLSLRATRPGVTPYPANWVLAQTWKWYLKTQVPVVRVACIEHDPLRLVDEIMLENIRFPKLDTYSLYGEKKKPAASVTIDVREAVMTYFITNGLTTANTSIAHLEPQVPNSLVIPIESRARSASSLALFVLRNSTSFDGSSRELAASTCTVDARWAKGHSVIESKGGGLVDQVLSYDFYGSQSRSIVDTELASDEIPFSWGEYHPKRTEPYKAVQIRRSWYELLSPRVTDASIPGGAADNSNTEGPGTDSFFTPSLLERMLAYLEVIFSTFFADGISRAAMPRHIDTWLFFPAWEYGYWNDSSESVYRTMIRSGNPVETFPQPAALQGGNGTRMVVKAVFTAYAMKIQGWFDWTSAVVLLLHALVAIAYTLWCLWEGQVGEGWDTIPELLALSQQSAPADGGILSNTCAGVPTIRTMEAVAMVENHPNSFNGLVNFGKEELCLGFRHLWDTKVPGTALMEDNEYGALRVG